jgi:hypothetical protein
MSSGFAPGSSPSSAKFKAPAFLSVFPTVRMTSAPSASAISPVASVHLSATTTTLSGG